MFYYKSKNYTIKLEALLLIQKLNLNFSRLKLMAIVTVLVKKFFWNQREKYKSLYININESNTRKTVNKYILYAYSYLTLYHSHFSQPPAARFFFICPGINLNKIHTLYSCSPKADTD